MEESNLISRANTLLTSLVTSYDKKYHVGTVVNGIYDTAWVAMVPKKPIPDLEDRWAFPECFDFLCREQAEDGGWGNPESRVEQITCTLLCLLVIQEHLAVVHQGHLFETPQLQLQADLQDRADRASEFIRLNLPSWNVDQLDTTLPMAMELWLPVIIERLEKHDIRFEIAGIDRIVKMRQEKLVRFPVDMLYRKHSTIYQPSVLFTLEGLIGVVDFGKLKHHTRMGSMFQSPASTAAYLMESPEWDPVAADYLRYVVEQSIVRNNRAVPIIFPSSIFDFIWVLNSFLENGFALNEFDPDTLKQVTDTIQTFFDEQGGVVGAEEGFCPDPDDTAMVLKALHSLGLKRSLKPMIDAFEGPSEYFTYKGERDPSISSNAHVLQALVLYSEDERYHTSIGKCTQYLCKSWWTSHRFARDKWNHSEYYSAMLIIRAFTDYLFAMSQGRVKALPDDLLKVQLPLVLIQCVTKTLLTQNSDGSWGSLQSKEDTAYAVIILKHVDLLPFNDVGNLQKLSQEAIKRGQAFISSNLDAPFRDYNWNGKCSYGLLSVAESAALSALRDDDKAPAREYSESVKSLYSLPMDEIAKQTKYFSSLPFLVNTPGWIVQAGVIEGILFSRRLREIDFMGQKKVLATHFPDLFAMIIPIVNYHKKYLFSNEIMFNFMDFLVSMAQLDHFIDVESAGCSLEQIESFKRGIYGLFPEIEPEPLWKWSNSRGIKRDLDLEIDHIHGIHDINGEKSKKRKIRESNGRVLEKPAILSAESEFHQHRSLESESDFNVIVGDSAVHLDKRVQELIKCFESLKQHLMSNERIKAVSPYQKWQFLSELRGSNLAQATTMSYGTSVDAISKTGLTLWDWGQTIGKQNSFSPMSIKFLVNQIHHRPGTDLFPTIVEKYLFEEFCHHESVLFRIANDCVSYERDQRDSTLNMVDMAINQQATVGTEDKEILSTRRNFFKDLVIYERELSSDALVKLEKAKHACPLTVPLMRWYQDLMDLFMDVYDSRNIYVRRV